MASSVDARSVRIRTVFRLAKRSKVRKNAPTSAMGLRPRASDERQMPWLFPSTYSGRTMTIVPFLNGKVFGPEDIQAMSTVLEDVCKILNLADEATSERELLAKKIIALARQSGPNAALLRDRILSELAYAQVG
jgi:hypothetical protein